MNNILMRLRQACCHPFLMSGQEPEVGRWLVLSTGVCRGRH
jgi:SNF2 family DNA or RNA helicase